MNTCTLHFLFFPCFFLVYCISLYLYVCMYCIFFATTSWWIKIYIYNKKDEWRKIKTEMLRRNGPVIKPWSQSWGRKGVYMVGKICEKDKYKVMIAADAGAGIAKVIDRAWRHWMMHEVAINRSVAPTRANARPRARSPPGIKHLPARNYRRRWSDIARSE